MNRPFFSSFGSKLRQGYRAYDRFMEKKGFYVLLGICVLVIVLSALYTTRLRHTLENPDLSQAQQQAIQSVGSAQGAQTLQEAKDLVASQGAEIPSSLALPTLVPFTFVQPLDGFASRIFSGSLPQYFAQSGTWQIHTGLDIEADFGSLVTACAAGKVVAVENRGLLGQTVVIEHAEGYESLYGGLSNAPYVRAGDPVASGQTIGHVGNGVLFEADAPPHLHLEVRKDGTLVDPLPLFLGVEE